MHSNDTIQNELKALNSMLAGISNRNVYTVPDGYFDVLSHDILLGIREETLQQTGKGKVPTGYFDGLADSIMGKIRAGEEEGSAILAGLKGVNVYDVPQGYFDGLADTITGKIESEVTEGSIIAGLKNINVYRVPPGYFDNLATNIVSKLSQPAKVITMERRPAIFRYAAAAVVTGIIGLSVISVFNKKQTENYTASTKEVMAKADDIIKKNSFDAELSTISDEAIVNYLKESGEDVNAALVASVADDKNLPDQVDYITDDKTLDNLLDELKTNN